MKTQYLFLVIMVLSLNAFGQDGTTNIILSQNAEKSSDTWEAFGHGIVNFEIDLRYIYGEIYVAASMPDSLNHTNPTFTEAYLYPAFNQFKKNSQIFVTEKAGESYFIIRVPVESQKVYQKLRQELRPYKEMLSYKSEGKWHSGKIRLLVHDDDLSEKIENEAVVLVSLVGGLYDIEKNLSTEYMPLIEAQFSELTNWNGIGNIPFDEFLNLKGVVQKIHDQGKKLVVFNCPATSSAWEVLKTSKADYIGSNDREKGLSFLQD